MLHPERRTAPLEQLKIKWGTETIDLACQKATQYWEVFQRAIIAKTPQPSPSPSYEASAKKKTRLGAKLEAMTVSYVQPQDEMRDYLSSSSGAHLEHRQPSYVIKWWYSQRHRWPILAQFAIEIFSIPAMSDDIERIFSGARRTISWERSRLGLDTVEAIECLATWFPYQFEKYFQVSQEQNQENEEEQRDGNFEIIEDEE